MRAGLLFSLTACLIACAPGVTIDGRPTVRVPDDEQQANPASPPSATEPAEPAEPEATSHGDRENMFERARRRDAVVIYPGEEPVKGASFGTLLHVDPPHASLPPLR